MPCTCGHSGTTTRAFQASRRPAPTVCPRRCCHQLPGSACQQNTVQKGNRSASDRHTGNLTLCRAQKQDEKEKDIVGGFDVDSEPGFLESEAVGIIFKVLFFLLETCSTPTAHFANCIWKPTKAACGRGQELNHMCCRLALWHLCPLELQPYCCWRDQ